MHYVYVLRCNDDSYYTGYTTDVARRVAEHDAGDGAKYTRGRTPVELVHVEEYDSQSAAMQREHEVKQLRRREKEDVVEHPEGVDPTDVLSPSNELGLDPGGDEPTTPAGNERAEID